MPHEPITTAHSSAEGVYHPTHASKIVQSVINYFDENALPDAAGIRLPNCSRKGLEKLLRSIQDEARI